MVWVGACNMREDIFRGQRRNLVLSPMVVASVCVNGCEEASICDRCAVRLVAGSNSMSCVGGGKF